MSRTPEGVLVRWGLNQRLQGIEAVVRAPREIRDYLRPLRNIWSKIYFSHHPGEDREDHIQQPDNQLWCPPPKIWALPTALFPHVCQVPEVCRWHNGHRPNQRRLGVCIQELEHLVHWGGRNNLELNLLKTLQMILLPPRRLWSCWFSSSLSASSLHLPDRLFCFDHQTGQIQAEKSSWDYREKCWS